MPDYEKKDSVILKIMSYLHDHVKAINDSKVFTGIMIIILNISSKFVDIKISKTMESYLRNTFSRQLLVFTIAWMGTRDIYVALFLTIFFTIFIDILWNENSNYCILTEEFTDYHLSLLDNKNNCNHFTKEDVEKAMSILEKAQKIVNSAKNNAIIENKTYKKQTLI